jgi:hypothetical protein
MGVISIISLLCKGIVIMGVSTKPGWMAFTRMSQPANSRAAVLVSPRGLRLMWDCHGNAVRGPTLQIRLWWRGSAMDKTIGERR